jgi:hypothetical protein
MKDEVVIEESTIEEIETVEIIIMEEEDIEANC